VRTRALTPKDIAMASLEEQVKDINYKRMRAWDAGNVILDRALREKRELTEEEKRGYYKASREVDRFDSERE
jgi:hypothetical protein